MNTEKNVSLAIAGDGPLENKLKEQAESLGVMDRVYFLGSVPHADIMDFLHAVDTVALPSIYEGMSNALLEALVAGKPIISSNIPAQDEVLQFDSDQPAGIRVSEPTPQAWSQAINQLVNDADSCVKLSLQASKRARYFTVESMVSRFEACLEAVDRNI